MDIEKLFYLVYFKFLEAYGEAYFLNHPVEDNRKRNCIKNFIFQKKNDWQEKKPYRQGMYAIEMSEKRRKKRRTFDKHDEIVYKSIAGSLLIAVLIPGCLVMVKKISISAASFFDMGAALLVGYIVTTWDYKKYKYHCGNVMEIYEDLQESEKIMQERGKLLLQILQDNMCERGYNKAEIIEFFIEQCESEISNSKISRRANATKDYIIPLLLGMCFLVPNKLSAIGISCLTMILILSFIFLFRHSIRIGTFKRSTREELCYRAFLDCLNYIKLKNTILTTDQF